jgi:hypothetical protein
MTDGPIRTLDQALLSAWQDELKATRESSLKQQLLQSQGELLPRFAEHYQQLKALPRRMRRMLQRQWKRSLAGLALPLAFEQAPTPAAMRTLCHPMDASPRTYRIKLPRATNAV